jgi:hypothetical protein
VLGEAAQAIGTEPAGVPKLTGLAARLRDELLPHQHAEERSL